MQGLEELPLMIFTLAVELGAGAFVIHVLSALLRKDSDQALLKKFPVVAVLCVLGVGLIASFFHLGNPLHAPYALLQLDSSWMTREIWAESLFIGLLIVVLICCITRKRTAVKILSIITAVDALFLIVCSGVAYSSMTAMPLWNSGFSVAHTIAASLILGILSEMVFLGRETAQTAEGEASVGKASQVLAICGCSLAVILVILIWALVSSLSGSAMSAARTSAYLMTSTYGVVFGFSVGIVALVAIGLFILAVKELNPGSRKTSVIVLLCAMIISEGLWRWLFYTVVVNAAPQIGLL